MYIKITETRDIDFKGVTTIDGKTVQSIFSGTTGQRPSSVITGFQYFDTTLGKPIWYNAANWVDATGAIV